MKKIVRLGGCGIAILIFGTIAYSLFLYQTDPFIKALVNHDESKLFYRPTKEVLIMEDLAYSENVIVVDDSIRIHTYLFHPQTESKANIFLIRGNSGNTSTYNELIRPLAHNGFRVYSLDWRGFGKSNGTPNYKGIAKDTEIAFLDFLKKIEKDSIKTIVYGMSLGGQLAIHLTKHHQDKVDALILDGSIASAHSFVIDNFPGPLESLFVRKPEAYNQDYVAVRDIANIENTPKLIIQSNKDRAVPSKRGKKIFSSAKEPKVFWETSTEHIKTLRDLPEETILKLMEIIGLCEPSRQ